MMDTSETYIKMCEEAEEIQVGHTFEHDDLCYLSDHRPSKVVVQLHHINNTRQVRVWLPRQDQLQEMVVITGTIIHAVYNGSEWLWQDSLNQLPLRFASMEQLWLAFVMKEKYNKMWEGGEWITSLK